MLSLGLNALHSFIIVLLIYGVSVTIALSPIGEEILRMVENCRLPATEQEVNYLIPIFEEVYYYAKELNPRLSNNIRIYIMDAMYINAFAMGRNTVAVTRGALESFTADELRGILAHELGHITYGHPKALLLSFVGNFFFSIMIWAFKLILIVIQTISDSLAHVNVVGFVCSFITVFIRLYVNFLVLVFVNLSQMILATNSRTNETQADTFAFEVGYGRELISSLYLLQKISMNYKASFEEQLKASHPHMAYRIAHLEWLENQEFEE